MARGYANSSTVQPTLVARGVDDPALSEEILRDVRATLRSGSVDRVA